MLNFLNSLAQTLSNEKEGRGEARHIFWDARQQQHKNFCLEFMTRTGSAKYVLVFNCYSGTQ